MKVSLKSNHCLFMQQVLRFLDLKSSISESCFSFQSSSRTVLITVHSLTGHCIMVSSHPPQKNKKKTKPKKNPQKSQTILWFSMQEFQNIHVMRKAVMLIFFYCKLLPFLNGNFLISDLLFVVSRQNERKIQLRHFQKRTACRRYFHQMDNITCSR